MPSNSRTFSGHLFVVHTFAISTEVWMVLTNLTPLLPEIAVYSSGYLAELGISGHYAAVTAAVLTGGASMMIPNCLAYRLYLLTREHASGFGIGPGAFHWLQAANYLAGAPAVYFLSNAQVPKALIPPDKDPLLLSPSVGYYNPKLNFDFIIGLSCCMPFAAHASIICVVSVIKSSPTVCKKSRELHRWAVSSCLIMLLPPLVVITLPTYVALYGAATAYFKVEQRYDIINQLIIPLFLGVSIPLMVNTLYSALWHKRSTKGRVLQGEKIRKKLVIMASAAKRSPATPSPRKHRIFSILSAHN